MTRIYKAIVYTTPWWQNQSTGRSMGSFNPSYALHSLQYTSSSIGSLPSQTVTFSRLKSSAIKAIVFASWKSIVWVLTSGVFSVIRLSERGEQIPKKKNLSAFFLYSASSTQKYFLAKLDHVLQIAAMLENLYSKTPAIRCSRESSDVIFRPVLF